MYELNISAIRNAINGNASLSVIESERAQTYLRDRIELSRQTAANAWSELHESLTKKLSDEVANYLAMRAVGVTDCFFGTVLESVAGSITPAHQYELAAIVNVESELAREGCAESRNYGRLELAVEKYALALDLVKAWHDQCPPQTPEEMRRTSQGIQNLLEQLANVDGQLRNRTIELSWEESTRLYKDRLSISIDLLDECFDWQSNYDAENDGTIIQSNDDAAAISAIMLGYNDHLRVLPSVAMDVGQRTIGLIQSLLTLPADVSPA